MLWPLQEAISHSERNVSVLSPDNITINSTVPIVQGSDVSTVLSEFGSKLIVGQSSTTSLKSYQLVSGRDKTSIGYSSVFRDFLTSETTFSVGGDTLITGDLEIDGDIVLAGQEEAKQIWFESNTSIYTKNTVIIGPFEHAYENTQTLKVVNNPSGNVSCMQGSFVNESQKNTGILLGTLGDGAYANAVVSGTVEEGTVYGTYNDGTIKGFSVNSTGVDISGEGGPEYVGYDLRVYTETFAEKMIVSASENIFDRFKEKNENLFFDSNLIQPGDGFPESKLWTFASGISIYGEVSCTNLQLSGNISVSGNFAADTLNVTNATVLSGVVVESITSNRYFLDTNRSIEYVYSASNPRITTTFTPSDTAVSVVVGVADGLAQNTLYLVSVSTNTGNYTGLSSITIDGVSVPNPDRVFAYNVVALPIVIDMVVDPGALESVLFSFTISKTWKNHGNYTITGSPSIDIGIRRPIYPCEGDDKKAIVSILGSEIRMFYDERERIFVDGSGTSGHSSFSHRDANTFDIKSHGKNIYISPNLSKTMIVQVSSNPYSPIFTVSDPTNMHDPSNRCDDTWSHDLVVRNGGIFATDFQNFSGFVKETQIVEEYIIPQEPNLRVSLGHVSESDTMVRFGGSLKFHNGSFISLDRDAVYMWGGDDNTLSLSGTVRLGGSYVDTFISEDEATLDVIKVEENAAGIDPGGTTLNLKKGEGESSIIIGTAVLNHALLDKTFQENSPEYKVDSLEIDELVTNTIDSILYNSLNISVAESSDVVSIPSSGDVNVSGDSIHVLTDKSVLVSSWYDSEYHRSFEEDPYYINFTHRDNNNGKVLAFVNTRSVFEDSAILNLKSMTDEFRFGLKEDKLSFEKDENIFIKTNNSANHVCFSVPTSAMTENANETALYLPGEVETSRSSVTKDTVPSLSLDSWKIFSNSIRYENNVHLDTRGGHFKLKGQYNDETLGNIHFSTDTTLFSSPGSSQIELFTSNTWSYRSDQTSFTFLHDNLSYLSFSKHSLVLAENTGVNVSGRVSANNLLIDGNQFVIPLEEKTIVGYPIEIKDIRVDTPSFFSLSTLSNDTYAYAVARDDGLGLGFGPSPYTSSLDDILISSTSITIRKEVFAEDSIVVPKDPYSLEKGYLHQDILESSFIETRKLLEFNPVGKSFETEEFMPNGQDVSSRISLKLLTTKNEGDIVNIIVQLLAFPTKSVLLHKYFPCRVQDGYIDLNASQDLSRAIQVNGRYNMYKLKVSAEDSLQTVLNPQDPADFERTLSSIGTITKISSGNSLSHVGVLSSSGKIRFFGNPEFYPGIDTLEGIDLSCGLRKTSILDSSGFIQVWSGKNMTYTLNVAFRRLGRTSHETFHAVLDTDPTIVYVIGSGNTTEQLQFPSEVLQVNSDETSTVARLVDGSVYVWGSSWSTTVPVDLTPTLPEPSTYVSFPNTLNEIYYIGTSGTIYKISPQTPPSLITVGFPSGVSSTPTKIEAGDDYVTVLTSDSKVVAWGYGGQGIFGQLSTHVPISPSNTIELTYAQNSTDLSASKNNLVASVGDTIYVSGKSSVKTLSTPLISPTTNLIDASIGKTHACAVEFRSSGNRVPLSWGDSERISRNISPLSRSVYPAGMEIPLSSTSEYSTKVVCGSSFTVTLTSSNTLYVDLVPWTPPDPCGRIVTISADHASAATLDTIGNVWIWTTLEPTWELQTDIPVKSPLFLAIGKSHTIVASETQVYAWGDNTFGQAPGIIEPMEKVLGVFAGDNCSGILFSNGNGIVFGEVNVGTVVTYDNAIQYEGVQDIQVCGSHSDGSLRIVVMSKDGSVGPLNKYPITMFSYEGRTTRLLKTLDGSTAVLTCSGSLEVFGDTSLDTVEKESNSSGIVVKVFEDETVLPGTLERPNINSQSATLVFTHSKNTSTDFVPLNRSVDVNGEFRTSLEAGHLLVESSHGDTKRRRRRTAATDSSFAYVGLDGTLHIRKNSNTGESFVLEDVNNISGGTSHYCVLKENGSVSVFADDTLSLQNTGQFGPSYDPEQKVFQIPLPSEAVLSSSDGNTIYVLGSDGRVFGWGNNTHGQLGLDPVLVTSIDTPQEIVVPGGPRIVDVRAGPGFAILLDETGIPWTLGINSSHKLGRSPITDADARTPGIASHLLIPGKRILSVSVGSDAVLALYDSDEVSKSTVSGYEFLDFGDEHGIVYVESDPTRVLALTVKGKLLVEGGESIAENISSFSSSSSNLTSLAIAVEDNKEFYVLWGPYVFGDRKESIGEYLSAPFFRARTTNKSSDSYVVNRGNVSFWESGPNPTVSTFPVLPGEDIVRVDVGQTFGMALTSGNRLYRWDTSDPLNTFGEETFAGGHVMDFAVYGNTCFFIELSGELFYYVFGVNIKSPVSGIPLSRTVVAGTDHALFLTSNGHVYSYGDNSDLQLGIPSPPASSTTAIKIPYLENIRHITAGDRHSAAVDSSGNVFVWGRGNALRQLSGVSNCVSVTLANTFGAVLMRDSTVWIYGDPSTWDKTEFSATSSPTVELISYQDRMIGVSRKGELFTVYESVNSPLEYPSSFLINFPLNEKGITKLGNNTSIHLNGLVRQRYSASNISTVYVSFSKVGIESPTWTTYLEVPTCSDQSGDLSDIPIGYSTLLPLSISDNLVYEIRLWTSETSNICASETSILNFSILASSNSKSTVSIEKEAHLNTEVDLGNETRRFRDVFIKDDIVLKGYGETLDSEYDLSDYPIRIFTFVSSENVSRILFEPVELASEVMIKINGVVTDTVVVSDHYLSVDVSQYSGDQVEIDIEWTNTLGKIILYKTLQTTTTTALLERAERIDNSTSDLSIENSYSILGNTQGVFMDIGNSRHCGFISKENDSSLIASMFEVCKDIDKRLTSLGA